MKNSCKTLSCLSAFFLSACTLAIAEQQTTTLTSYSAENYTGVDINVNFGGSALRAKVLDLEPNQAPDNQHFAGMGYAVQGKVGASYGFCTNWVVGIDGYGQYNDAETKDTYTVSSTGNSVSRTFKIDWSFGLDLRLGVVSSLSGLVFIYGGPDWGHYDFKESRSIPTIEIKFTDYKLGGGFGAGFEQKLTQSWFLRSTFDYTWYPSRTYAGSFNDLKITPDLATFLFQVGYLF